MQSDRQIFTAAYPLAAIILSLWCVFIKTHTYAGLIARGRFSKLLTFTIWMLKLRRGLGLSLIRSCGAKSNQSKREQRAKPSPCKRVSVVCAVWLLSEQDFGGWRFRRKATSPHLRRPLLLPLMRLCLVVKERGSEKGGGGEFFSPLTPPPTPPTTPPPPALTLLNLDKSIWYRCNLLISSWHYHCSPCCGGMGPVPLA